MNWCRLWHDMPNDPKFRTIARLSESKTSDVISIFIHLMVSASANASERGRTQPNAEDIASALDLDTERVEAVLEAMQGRVLESEHLTGWEKRQPRREDGGAERARNWRENKKLEKSKENANATERNRTQPNAPDKIRLDKNTNTEQLSNGRSSTLQENKNLSATAEQKSPGSEGAGNRNGNGVPESVRWPYLGDPEFSSFVVAACEYWPDLIEEDLQKSWQFTWKKLDFEQRIEVVKRLHVRIEAGDSSQFVARPPKYLENGDWKRPPRASNGNGNGTHAEYKKPKGLVTDEVFRKLKQEQEERSKT